MKKACKYCGKIHDRNEKCDKKPVFTRGSKEDLFRNTQAWKDKRESIKKRDRYLCQACLNGLYGTEHKLTTEGLSVHHIRSLKSNYELRLDDDNLITLCSNHHELAEKGAISASELLKIVPPRDDIYIF